MPPPRLSAVDASFLYLERPRTPMHVGAVGVFATPDGGFDYDHLVETVERRLMSRPLDPDRPLWETYLVEGLADGRFAVITKTHQAMVDGITTIDIGQVLLDTTPEPTQAPHQLWMPRPEPSDAELVARA